jgi:hypothetical protein
MEESTVGAKAIMDSRIMSLAGIAQLLNRRSCVLPANTVPTRQPYPKLNVMGVKKEKHGCNENYTVTSFCLSLSF